MRGVVVLLALAGCYHPAYDDCAVSCAESGLCPSGFDCMLGVCRSQSGACGGGGDVDAATIDGWRFRKKVTFSPTSTVTAFPAPIRRVEDPDLANFAQADGDDIRFTTTDGMALPHEVERFVKSTGELVAWVQIPRFVAGQPLDIYLYYGNDAAPDQQTPAAVWDTDFSGVWHLADPPGATIADSTIALRDGVKGLANTPAAVDTGIFAGAQQFTGSTTDYFSLANTTKVDNTALTFEAWVRTELTPNPIQRRLYTSPVGFMNPYGIGYVDSTTANGGYFTTTTQDSTAVLQSPSGIDPTGKWRHVMFVYGGNTGSAAGVQLFVDGMSQQLFDSPVFTLPSGPTLAIGGFQGSNYAGFLGTMDEVRLSSTVRSQEYAAQSVAFATGPSSLVSVGPAEVR